jgi:hypothetical protein
MIARHLTEEEIQLYALDSRSCAAAIGLHVHTCEDCKAKVTAYQLLFAGIEEQPAPAFDFNLADAVLAQLPLAVSSPKEKAFNPFYFLIAGAVLLAGTAIFLFDRYVPGLLITIVPLFLYLIVPTVIIMLVMLIMEMQKSYRKKMASLDFY